MENCVQLNINIKSISKISYLDSVVNWVFPLRRVRSGISYRQTELLMHHIGSFGLYEIFQLSEFVHSHLTGVIFFGICGLAMNSLLLCFLFYSRNFALWDDPLFWMVRFKPVIKLGTWLQTWSCPFFLTSFLIEFFPVLVPLMDSESTLYYKRFYLHSFH